MILSILVLVIIIYGLYKKIDIFDSFIEGSKEGYKIILNLFPTLLGMIFAINIFLGSGLLDDIFKKISISSDLLSLMILRPISSSSSLAILDHILGKYGPDSYIGILASIMQGSTDTTIYILALYFGSIGIKKTRYALANGLLADLLSYIIAFIILNIYLHFYLF